LILGQPNRYHDLYDPRRASVVSEKQGTGLSADAPKSTTSDAPEGSRDASLDSIPPGAGAVR
jgi:hypothetical protein